MNQQNEFFFLQKVYRECKESLIPHMARIHSNPLGSYASSPMTLGIAFSVYKIILYLLYIYACEGSENITLSMEVIQHIQEGMNSIFRKHEWVYDAFPEDSSSLRSSCGVCVWMFLCGFLWSVGGFLWGVVGGQLMKKEYQYISVCLGVSSW